MSTGIIIFTLAFIVGVSLYKLYKENEFKRVAREGMQFIDELMQEGLTKSEAYGKLTPEHKQAINECDRLKLKY